MLEFQGADTINETDEVTYSTAIDSVPHIKPFAGLVYVLFPEIADAPTVSLALTICKVLLPVDPLPYKVYRAVVGRLGPYPAGIQLFSTVNNGREILIQTFITPDNYEVFSEELIGLSVRVEEL
ncbi:MAG TPA: hypothetical protein PK671_00395 [Candidatus Obscuribacter sp.]|nr:hypothetical protein [Candidatus Obscuribacter sp.]HMY51368.1 hypothetical protein [Candidatus Obscuribacter sp.]